MEVIKISNQVYQIGKVVPVKEMLPSMSVSELMQSSQDKEMTKKNLTAFITLVAAKYLSLNIKSRAITNEAGYMLISEFILDECKNLELQEIEYIFKKGVMGRFGDIYNDISIDTICGLNGWIENYYKKDRKEKNDSLKIEHEIRFSGNEISEKEFLIKYPIYEKRQKIRDLAEKAKLRKAKMDDIKEFYKLKELTLDDLKDDLQELSKQYYQMSDNEKQSITYDQYQNMWIQNFIVTNEKKVKE
jgi:hypothetical protein